MTSTSFYFYDLETSSGSARDGRVMQFAGQRTDADLNLIGDPDNILVKLADDILPEPEAILVHRITPQKTLEEGISEAEFAKFFQEKVALPNTIFVGYNNIRFDDEFMRRVFYRTFYDPYQWHWSEGRSRWDLLDPIRMMRALRPEGLKWPLKDGKPTVGLEAMAKENGLLHENAHDALSDVKALIQLAQKYQSSQPKLFQYLLSLRDKKQVAKLIHADEPFVYTSGRYTSKYEKTTVVQTLFLNDRKDNAFLYDLRYDPDKWSNKSVDELFKHWQPKYGSDIKPLPVSKVQFNHCPALAPLSVLDEESCKRINIDLNAIRQNLEKLKNNIEFVKKLKSVQELVDKEQQTTLPLNDSVDYQLYDGFWGDTDQLEMASVRSSSPTDLLSLENFKNKRIREMLPLYIARNFPSSLNPDQKQEWEDRRRELFYKGSGESKYAKFSKRMLEITKTRPLTDDDKYLLTELQLYAESILPEPE